MIIKNGQLIIEDMNWGHKIVLAFILFAAFIGYMVVRAFQEDFDLVAEDYYAQEINYQQKLNKLSNTAEDGKSVVVKQKAGEILLTFPDEIATGNIHFYHPSRKIFDRTFEISLTDYKQKIERSELVAGSYRVNITWRSNDTDYYQQSSIYIQ
ncbi:FixH family protein [Ekhidna sp.]|uniref:FixH family protein n=1 Tax=Ekhidna sp. TaxID=2608089 RepID=UPI003299622D